MTHLEIKKSRNRLGLYTTTPIKANSVVEEIKGKIVNYKLLLQIGGAFQDNCIRFSELTYITPQGYEMEFINHSCEPNCRIDKQGKKLYLITIKDIKKNQELTFDYATVLASDDIWTMTCNCGTKACRGVVKKYTTLPKDLRNEYIQKNIIPQYILNI